MARGSSSRCTTSSSSNVPEAEVEEAATLLHDAMCAAYEMEPPLEAEVGVGDDWVAAKS